MMRPSHEYVLGTHPAEDDRLALQHALWLDEVRHAWRTAGITHGSRVLDIGCGPGHAVESLLAEVGPTGKVAGLEISPEFVANARARATACGRADTDVRLHDLMTAPLPEDMRGAFDATWCRWVAMFVSDPARLIHTVSEALAPGGRAVFHEYIHYGSYALHPHGPRVAEFVQKAMQTFAMNGGDANIASRLPQLLSQAGLRITAMRPIARVARPHDPLWNWPAGFIRTYAPRLVALGLADQAWVAELLKEIEDAESRGSEEGVFLVAPTLMEVVAERAGP